MDIIKDTRPRKNKRAVTWAVVGLAVVVLLTLAVRSLPSASPTVERATLYSDTVERGDMIRTVRGPGTLVSEQARLLTAVTNGRIEEIVLLPGSPVEPGAVIMRLSNPDVQMQLLEAQTQLSQARSQLAQLRSNLETQRLTQRGQVAQIERQYLDARRTWETNQKLAESNPDLVARAELDRSREQMEELELRFALERDRLEVLDGSAGEQVEAQLDQVRRLEETVAFNQDRLRSLEVTSPVAGVLAPVAVQLQEGQWVQSGQELGRVVVPGRLKAELRIAQTQVQELAVGQEALVDTRSDTIVGQVARIDPAVRGGTVTIDVALPESLPASARPDQSVDGNVVIERLIDVVHVARPNHGQPNQRVSVFRITGDGAYAERVQVLLGNSSVNDIEVKEGLQPGDVVVLSDMSRYDGFDRVRIK